MLVPRIVETVAAGAVIEAAEASVVIPTADLVEAVETSVVDLQAASVAVVVVVDRPAASAAVVLVVDLPVDLVAGRQEASEDLAVVLAGDLRVEVVR